MKIHIMLTSCYQSLALYISRQTITMVTKVIYVIFVQEMLFWNKFANVLMKQEFTEIC